jgi:hypothetical protein
VRTRTSRRGSSRSRASIAPAAPSYCASSTSSPTRTRRPRACPSPCDGPTPASPRICGRLRHGASHCATSSHEHSAPAARRWGRTRGRGGAGTGTPRRAASSSWTSPASMSSSARRCSYRPTGSASRRGSVWRCPRRGAPSWASRRRRSSRPRSPASCATHSSRRAAGSTWTG